MDKQEYIKIWQDILEVLRISVSDATYKTYLSHTHLIDLKEVGDRVIAEVGCESFFIKQQAAWLAFWFLIYLFLTLKNKHDLNLKNIFLLATPLRL